MQSRNKRNIIVISIGAIGLVLIIVTALILYQRNKFIRYSSYEDGYSISYPASWAIKEKSDGASVIFLSAQESAFDIFMENVNVVVQDLSNNPRSLDSYTETAILQLQAVFQQNMEIIANESFYLSGQPAHKIVFTAKGDQADLKFMNVWTIKGQKAYQITYAALIDKFDTYLGKADRIINSFNIE